MCRPALTCCCHRGGGADWAPLLGLVLLAVVIGGPLAAVLIAAMGLVVTLLNVLAWTLVACVAVVVLGWVLKEVLGELVFDWSLRRHNRSMTAQIEHRTVHVITDLRPAELSHQPVRITPLEQLRKEIR